MDKKIKGQYMFNGILLYNDNYESYLLTNGNSRIQKLSKVKGFKTIHRLNNLPVISTFVHLISYFIYFFKMFGFSMEHLNKEIKEDIKDKNENSKIIDISKKFNVYLTDVILIVSILSGLIISIVLFGLLPWILFETIIYYTNAYFAGNIAIATYKILLLFLLIYFSSKIDEIKNVYMYHTTKHKIDKCIENNTVINFENIKKQKYDIAECKSTQIFAAYIYSTILFAITELYMIEIQGIVKLFLTIIVYLFFSFMKKNYANTKFHNIIISPAKCFSRYIQKEPNDDIIDIALSSYDSLISINK